MTKERGITLVALVITIILLLILAGVALSTLTGNDNIIKNAGTVVGEYNSQQESDEAVLNTIAGYLEQYMQGGGELPLITTASGIHSETTEYQDAKGNKIVVPGGFEVVISLATTVDKGIVIRDSIGNEFVWVPIGTITKSDDTEVTIELGRYGEDHVGYYFTSTSIPTQYAKDNRWQSEIIINDEFFEVTSYRESLFSEYMPNSNATARDLQTFITNAFDNGGYYIARYEASFGSGAPIVSVENGSTSAESAGRAAITNQKPAFKQSTIQGDNMETITSTPGMLWTCIRQGDASLACQNLYAGNEYNGKSYVESDLINSYAWDTALMFMFQCSDKTTDVFCNIYNLLDNLFEWTTESSNYDQTTRFYPTVYRNDCYDSGSFYIFRYSCGTADGDEDIGFRAVLTCTPVS